MDTAQLLNQDSINEFNPDWTVNLGSALLDVSRIYGCNWSEEKDERGNPLAIKICPLVTRYRPSEGHDIKRIQVMVSATPQGCTWEPNCLVMPLTEEVMPLARLVLDTFILYRESKGTHKSVS